MIIKLTPRKLKGTIEAIPSKSHAHRVLIAQKLAELQGNIKDNPLEIPSFSKDIEATKNCLAALDEDSPVLDCNESGSTLRFMIPVAMALKTKATFVGRGKLPQRPISPLKEEMEAHGCKFNMNETLSTADNHTSQSDGNSETICSIYGTLQPGEYKLAGNISSQFITGLLFALPLLNRDSTLTLTTKLESAGYVDLSLDVLRDFGITITQNTSDDSLITYTIPGNQTYTEPENLKIEGDWSNAAFWLACGVLGGNITCTGLNMNSSQRDKEFMDILSSMGADITINGDSVTAKGCGILNRKHNLTATIVSVAQIPDIVPVLSATMAVATGSSMITDAERLKIKESDRLATVQDILASLGADITDGGTGLSITGRPKLEGGHVKGHNDHRIVMTAAVASCVCKAPVTIDGAEAVNKSYPDFFRDFVALGGHVKEL